MRGKVVCLWGLCCVGRIGRIRGVVRLLYFFVFIFSSTVYQCVSCVPGCFENRPECFYNCVFPCVSVESFWRCCCVEVLLYDVAPLCAYSSAHEFIPSYLCLHVECLGDFSVFRVGDIVCVVRWWPLYCRWVLSYVLLLCYPSFDAVQKCV